jgi:hypothetical protein
MNPRLRVNAVPHDVEACYFCRLCSEKHIDQVKKVAFTVVGTPSLLDSLLERINSRPELAVGVVQLTKLKIRKTNLEKQFAFKVVLTPRLLLEDLDSHVERIDSLAEVALFEVFAAIRFVISVGAGVVIAHGGVVRQFGTARSTACRRRLRHTCAGCLSPCTCLCGLLWRHIAVAVAIDRLSPRTCARSTCRRLLLHIGTVL